MILADLAQGSQVYVDANIFVYYFAPDPVLGPPCRAFFDRVARGELQALVSTHGLLEVAHRLMTLEAMQRYHWPIAGIAARLRKHAAQIATLSGFQSAIKSVPILGVSVVPIDASLVDAATAVAIQSQLLCGDALLVATMQRFGLSQLASHDRDFDKIPGIARYLPA